MAAGRRLRGARGHALHVSIWGGVRSSLVLWKESFRKSSFFVLLSSCCGQVRSSSFRVRVPCPGSQKFSSSSVRPSELPGCGGWDVGEQKRKYGGASPEGVTRSGPPAFPNRLPPFPNRVPSTVGKYVTRIFFRAYQEALDFLVRGRRGPRGTPSGILARGSLGLRRREST